MIKSKPQPAPTLPGGSQPEALVGTFHGTASKGGKDNRGSLEFRADGRVDGRVGWASGSFVGVAFEGYGGWAVNDGRVTISWVNATSGKAQCSGPASPSTLIQDTGPYGSAAWSEAEGVLVWAEIEMRKR